MNEKILFATNTNPDIVNNLINSGKYRKGKAQVKRFADQEVSVLLEEDVENLEVTVLGSTNPPAENLLELLILIHTIKQNGAKKLTVLIPYWGYAKADRIKPKGATLSAKLMAESLELAGANSVSIVNIHSELARRFFKIPFSYLDALPLFAGVIEGFDKTMSTIISPDKGGVERAERFANLTGIRNVVYIEKVRPEFDEVEITKIAGDVKGQNCIIIDDMIQSGGTILENAKALKSSGASKVIVIVTHIIHTGGSIPKLEGDKNIDKVYFTNSILCPTQLSEKFEVIDISSLFS